MARRRPAARDDELRRVFQDHVGAVYAHFVYSVDASTAEDLTSATFEKVLRSWKRYDSTKASERTWIISIARNTLIDYFRRASHRNATSIDEHPALLESLSDDIDFVGRKLDADELRWWLSVLGDREREILALRYGADLSAADIAGIVGLSAGNVHQVLSRSLRKLRETAERTSGQP